MNKVCSEQRRPMGRLTRFKESITRGSALHMLRVLALLMLAAPPVGALAAGENTLDAISFSSLPGERVRLNLRISGPAPTPLSFTIDNPARVALDFQNTKSALATKSQDVGMGVTRSIDTVDVKGRTRVVINLSRMVPYQTQVSGNEVIVTLAGSPEDTALDTTEAAAVTVTSGGETVIGSAAGRSVTNVDFRRGPEGEGRVLITLSDPNTPIDLQDQAGKVVLDIYRAALPSELEKRLDVIDFATPVQTIDTFEAEGNIRMVIAASGKYDQLAYQSGNVFTVEIKRFVEDPIEEAEREKVYEGEKLSLNFQDIEVRSVLQLIADFTGKNVVVSDSVDGNLTLRLKNVPWDQALDIIMKTKGLAMRENGNVLLVAPADELAAREKQELEDKESIEQLLPLRTELIQINYAKATEIAALLISSQAPTADDGGDTEGVTAGSGGTVLSPRGSVMVDDRTNTLIVRDTDPSILAIRRLINRLDIPVRQVLIDSRVVIASDDFSRELGVVFGVNAEERVTRNGDVGRLHTSGRLNGTTQQINGETLEFDDRMNVNMPVIDPAGSFAIALAKLPLGLLLELELSAAQAEDKAEVVSSPRVITSNQRKAVIRQGVELPYLQDSSSGATNVVFKEAVLKLEVTPSITPDDRVSMDLLVHKDNVGELFGTSQIPSIDTRSVETQVLVDNGQTIVLGGVYEQETLDSIKRVPFFSDIPVLGHLFRSTVKEDNKSELLIFVTPKIVSENLSLAQ